jgi:adenylyltransferase/sulfurtransferase
MLIEHIGEEGQQRLARGSAVVVGVGALGCMAADLLGRAGVGRLTLVDRDVVETVNLHRQVLFTQAHADAAMPKAHAAAQRLHQVNPEVQIEALAVDFAPENAERIVRGHEVIVDGTDNFDTRLLINDAAVKLGIGYVYGGAIATEGSNAVILPRSADGDRPWERQPGPTPCLRCMIHAPPPPGSLPTCDTAGVLAPVATIVASREATDAIKMLIGRYDALDRRIGRFDLWSGEQRSVALGDPDPQCPCCAKREFDFLEGRIGSSAQRVCGRLAVQVKPSGLSEAGEDEDEDGPEVVDLEKLAEALRRQGEVNLSPFSLRFRADAAGQTYLMTVFPDGRAMVQGTNDPAVARSLYSRFIGL